ncbi:hypothetical protein H072_1166 [Dactylellina haptotyla CBS 200.50]|uniref:JmjC domain-containing protein n=1 Tax=Dactylellina haptotyla (strain CBS 200.50) TaxID=1284197 RepID=S8AV47_DACHA|nr:hypothetical protein H072_1166 [Dactylellina haptotyla CBS 200.50]
MKHFLRHMPRRLFSTTRKPKSFKIYPADEADSFAHHRHTTKDIPPTKFTDNLFVHRLPAFTNWFLPTATNRLNIQYLLAATQASKSDPLIPIEITTPQGVEQATLPFTAFLGYLSAPSIHPDSPRLYLAQHPAPSFLDEDVPQPFSGLGFTLRGEHQSNLSQDPSSLIDTDIIAATRDHEVDIYASSLWLSRSSPATNTPLHRDPNDNLFVQLAGSKIIRALPPNIGDALFRSLALSGRTASIDPRGRIRDGLLDPRESRVFDSIIWGWDGGAFKAADIGLEREIVEAIDSNMYETTVERGDGVYIPRGWWHAVRSLVPSDIEEQESGAVTTVVASMNWWFR